MDASRGHLTLPSAAMHLPARRADDLTQIALVDAHRRRRCRATTPSNAEWTSPAFRLRWQPGGLTRTLRVGKGLDPDDPPVADGQER
jgi:hypothetical protein